MMKSTKMQYDGISQDDSEDPRTDPLYLNILPASGDPRKYHGIRCSLIVLGIAMLIGLVLVISLPIILTKKNTMGKIVQVDESQSLIFGSELDEPEEVTKLSVHEFQNFDDEFLEQESSSNESQEVDEKVEIDDSSLEESNEKVTQMHTEQDTTAPNPVVQSEVEELDDDLEANSDETADLQESEESLESFEDSSSPPSSLSVPDADEDAESSEEDNSSSKVKEGSSGAIKEEEIENPTVENDDKVEDNYQNSESIIDGTEKKDLTLQTEDGKMEYTKWDGTKGTISTTAMGVIAALGALCVSFFLFAVSCLLRTKQKRNRKVTIKNMVTDLHSPDKVILLNEESSEEE